MNNNNSNSGIGFHEVLAVVFIVLKLLKIINWSWWWVLSPLWIWAIICIVVWVIAIICS